MLLMLVPVDRWRKEIKYENNINSFKIYGNLINYKHKEELYVPKLGL